MVADALVMSVNGHTPVIHEDAFLAPGAVVAGNVSIGPGASVWFGCVLRAEAGAIRVGADSNLQDGTVVHADPDFDTTIGARVTVGHRAVVHGCSIDDDALVGMGAVVLNGAEVGAGAVVAAGAVVTEGATVAPDTVVVGTPARPRDITPPPTPRPNVAAYLQLAAWYREAVSQSRER